MTKLKTLYDLILEIPEGLICACGECDLRGVKVSVLKAEAIKRVKAIIKEDNHDHEGINCAYCKLYLSDVNFILKFFNITEEDLE